MGWDGQGERLRSERREGPSPSFQHLPAMRNRPQKAKGHSQATCPRGVVFCRGGKGPLDPERHHRQGRNAPWVNGNEQRSLNTEKEKNNEAIILPGLPQIPDYNLKQSMAVLSLGGEGRRFTFICLLLPLYKEGLGHPLNCFYGKTFARLPRQFRKNFILQQKRPVKSAIQDVATDICCILRS